MNERETSSVLVEDKWRTLDKRWHYLVHTVSFRRTPRRQEVGKEPKDSSFFLHSHSTKSPPPSPFGLAPTVLCWKRPWVGVYLLSSSLPFLLRFSSKVLSFFIVAWVRQECMGEGGEHMEQRTTGRNQRRSTWWTTGLPLYSFCSGCPPPLPSSLHWAPFPEKLTHRLLLLPLLAWTSTVVIPQSQPQRTANTSTATATSTRLYQTCPLDKWPRAGEGCCVSQAELGARL